MLCFCLCCAIVYATLLHFIMAIHYYLFLYIITQCNTQCTHTHIFRNTLQKIKRQQIIIKCATSFYSSFMHTLQFFLHSDIRLRTANWSHYFQPSQTFIMNIYQYFHMHKFSADFSFFGLTPSFLILNSIKALFLDLFFKPISKYQNLFPVLSTYD